MQGCNVGKASSAFAAQRLNLPRRLSPSSRRSCSSDRHRGASADGESRGLQCAACPQVFSEARCPDSHLRTDCCHCLCLRTRCNVSITTSFVVGCSVKNCSICCSNPCLSVSAMIAKCSVGGASSVRSKSRVWMRWNESSRLRYSASPCVVAKFQSGCPCATHKQSHKASQDLPIFGAPARMCKPSGMSSSTRNGVGSYVLILQIFCVDGFQFGHFFTSFRFYLL